MESHLAASAPDRTDFLVGQMFMLGFQGVDCDAGFTHVFRTCLPGGVILFQRNCRSADQVRRLTAELQGLARACQPEPCRPEWSLPLLVAVDQEGGNLSPLRGIVTPLPGNMALAATGDPSAARYAGYVTGRDLASLGVSVNLAPVLDLALEPGNPVVGTRAFSDSARTTATFGREFAEGTRAAGILLAAKHFPGHGSCLEDSHRCLPVCDDPVHVLWERDIRPFREVIGLEGAAVMVAHVRYAAIDPWRPASVSPLVVGRLLREELGFDGVVMTDCLEMAAIGDFSPVAEAAVLAVEAGCDMVLVSHTPDAQLAAFRAVREAVALGRLSLERVEASVHRIRRWKQLALARSARRGTQQPGPDVGAAPAGPEWTPARIAWKAITLIPGNRPWPFDHSPIAVVEFEEEPTTAAQNRATDTRDLCEELTGLGVACRRVCCPVDPSPADAERIGGVLAGWGVPRVAVDIASPPARAGQARLVDFLGKRWDVLLVSTRDPREVLPFGSGPPALLAYSREPEVLRALARVMCGEVSAEGRLPVKLVREPARPQVP